MNDIRQKIILDFARWTVLSALRSGSPVKSRKDVYPLLDSVAFSDVLDSRIPITQEGFDEWHKDQTHKLCSQHRSLPIGWGVKMLNVYLKTAAYIGDLGPSGLRESIHPPIDSGLWQGIREKFSKDSEILGEVCCVQKIKDITDYATYVRIIRGCTRAAKDLGCNLIEVEQLWQGSDTPTVARGPNVLGKATVATDLETVRNRYRPNNVRLLLVGESPPESGKFFYMKSAMTTHTAHAFESAHGRKFSNTEAFLEHFKHCGCFLEDLSRTPVDQWSSKKRDDHLRNEVSPLSQRIKALSPSVVVIFLKRIAPYVQEAVEMSGCNPVVYVLPFPGSGHQTKYKSELATIVSKHLT
jgi:hypothetical protein